MSSRLTVGELEVQLKDLVCNWDSFGRQLPGITESAIEEIKYNKRDNVKSLKAALFGEWLEVYPDASWDDVITGLQKIGKNTIAKHVEEWLSSAVDKQMSLSPKPPLQTESKAVSNTPTQLITQPNHKQQPTHSQQVYKVQYGPVNSKLCATPSLQQKEYKVSESIVEELEDLHETFVPLATEVKRQIQEEVVNGKVSIQTLASYVHEQSVGPQSRDLPITSATNTEQILQSVQPAYTFLSPNFILNLATFFLVLYPIANKADEYKSRVTAFKKSPKVRLLKNKLGRFNEKFRNSSSHILLKILVTNAWGEQSIRLVEMLLLTLFPIVHPDDLPWYSVCAGSILLSFIATNHMMLPLIVSCARKIELMRHLGIISVTIGNILIRVNKDGPQAPHDDDSLTFEDCLIQATASDSIEAVEFLLKYALVSDVNIRSNRDWISQLQIKQGADYIAEDAEVLKQFKHILKIMKSEISDLPLSVFLTKNADSESNQSQPSTNFLSIDHDYELLNTSKLRNQSNHLPNPVRDKLIDVCKFIERTKGAIKVTSLQKFLQQSAPPLNYTTQVTVTLHRVWSECNVRHIDYLITLIFPQTNMEDFYWYQVKESKRALTITLITQKPSQFVISSFLSVKALGVIEVQINNETSFESTENRDEYTFEKGLKEAEKHKMFSVKDILESVQESPCIPNLKVFQPDNNNNELCVPDYDATPLIIACCNSNSKLVQLLLEHGADPNIKTDTNFTALFYSTNSSKICKLLLNHGADLMNISTQSETVLHRACISNNLKVVDIVLNSKYPDINRAAEGYTALWRACSLGHVEIVDRLLQAKADPNIPDIMGITPLLEASASGHLPVVQRLLKSQETTGPNLFNAGRVTPLWAASFEGQVAVVKYLLQHVDVNPNHRAQNGSTPLWCASKNGHKRVVKSLLKAKADPNISDNTGKTPLWIASRYGHEGIVKYLLKAKVDPTIPDNDGITPYSIANTHGHEKIGRILLESYDNVHQLLVEMLQLVQLHNGNK